MAELIISTEEQYEEALDQVLQLLQTHLAIGSREGKELNVLVTLVEQYEDIHYPIQNKLE